MRNIFSYDSLLMRILTRLFDIVILSIVFVICSLPIITIGAAQSALLSSIRAMLEPQKEITPLRAFFKAFTSGFGKITLVWIFCLIPIGFSLYIIWGSIISAAIVPSSFMFVCALIMLCCLSFQIMTSLLHSRFDCSFFNLIKNSWLMTVTYPLRSLFMGIMVWIPLFFALMEPYIFLASSPIFVFFYYTLVFMLCYYLIKDPFLKIEKQYFPNIEA